MQFPKKHSKETIEAVCRLRTEGRSAKEIAIELSLGSRCVVIGLWNRNMEAYLIANPPPPKLDSLGRITEYAPEVKERAFELLKEWSPVSVGSQMGIPYTTINDWIRRRRGEVETIKSEAKPVVHRLVRNLALDDNGFSAPVRETIAIPNYGRCKYVFGEDDTFRYCAAEPVVTEYPRSYCAACETRMRGKSLPAGLRQYQANQRARASAREMMGLA